MMVGPMTKGTPKQSLGRALVRDDSCWTFEESRSWLGWFASLVVTILTIIIIIAAAADADDVASRMITLPRWCVPK